MLSPDERASLLREVRAVDVGTRVPVRTSRDAQEHAPRGGSGSGSHGGNARPPQGERPGKSSFPRRRRLRTTVLVLLVLVMLVGGIFSAKILNVGRNVLSPDRSIFGQLADLLFHGERRLQGEQDKRINILLTAIGGKGHQGENLADTIMVASFRPETKDVALLSIPRDLYVKNPQSSSYMKINAVHAYRENTSQGEGLLDLKKKVEEITGLPIHYYARVDFQAFKRIVDEIGGVRITIHEGFYDYWHKISFPAGEEDMRGERALAYARARYVEGSQGGDFKRAERQQQLLLAIRSKFFSTSTAFDLRALSGVLDALGDNVVTNFQLWELKRLYELTRDLPKERIHTTVLTAGPNGLLVGGTEILEGKPAAVLRPRAGLEKFDEIREFAQGIFDRAPVMPSIAPTSPETPPLSPTAETTSSPLPSPSPTTFPMSNESPTVEIRNGTAIQGLAARVGTALTKSLFTIAEVRNAATRDRTVTLVVDLTGGKKPNSLQALLAILRMKTSVKFPQTETSSKADFLVLLGTDVADTFK